MTRQQTAELKTIADNFKARPVEMSVRMTNLIKELGVIDRHNVADTLRDMLCGAYARQEMPVRQIRDANDRLD